MLPQLSDDRVVAVFLSGALLALAKLGHDLDELRQVMRYCLAIQVAMRNDAAKDEFEQDVEKPDPQDPRLIEAVMSMIAAIQSMGGLGTLLAVYRYCENSAIWEQVREHVEQKAA